MPRLNDDERASALAALQSYFRDERDEELGDLAAGLLLDHLEETLGVACYNQGVRDAQAVVARMAGSMEEELDLLEVRAPR